MINIHDRSVEACATRFLQFNAIFLEDPRERLQQSLRYKYI